jgi:hypothetical protein
MHLMKVLVLFSLVFTLSNASFAKKKANLEYYQLEAYQYTTQYQEEQLDSYLKNAYLPALHKIGLTKIGVFKPIANDTAAIKTIYVLLPFKSWEKILELPQQLLNDAEYNAKAKDFIDAPYKNPPYKRKNITLLQAFSMAPQMSLPQLTAPLSERIYELRSYESYTDAKYKNKVHMFNEGGEVVLFKKLNFNAIFYGEVIAGDKMPNLMYITSFNNMNDRDEHWKAFNEAPEWKELSSKEFYKKNVSKAEIILTKAAPYSDY